MKTILALFFLLVVDGIRAQTFSRLFTTPEQRARLERRFGTVPMRRPPPEPVSVAVAPDLPSELRFDGYLLGPCRTTLWVNGEQAGKHLTVFHVGLVPAGQPLPLADRPAAAAGGSAAHAAPPLPPEPDEILRKSRAEAVEAPENTVYGRATPDSAGTEHETGPHARSAAAMPGEAAPVRPPMPHACAMGTAPMRPTGTSPAEAVFTLRGLGRFRLRVGEVLSVAERRVRGLRIVPSAALAGAQR